MVEILLFSLSISIDAFGYSLGFGSRNVNIKPSQFLVLNLINTLILTLYITTLNKLEYLFQNPLARKISPILVAILGLYYVSVGFYGKICKKKQIKKLNKKTKVKHKNNAIKLNNIAYKFPILYSVKQYEYNGDKLVTKIKSNRETKQNLTRLYNVNSYLNSIDFLLLILVFIFENAFSSFVFFSNFNNAFLFIFSNFIFHFLFFVLGFRMGKTLAVKINSHTSFLSGYIFLCLACFELFF